MSQGVICVPPEISAFPQSTLRSPGDFCIPPKLLGVPPQISAFPPKYSAFPQKFLHSPESTLRSPRNLCIPYGGRRLRIFSFSAARPVRYMSPPGDIRAYEVLTRQARVDIPHRTAAGRVRIR